MAATTGARLLGRFFGNTVSSAAGFGAGVALGPVLAPAVRLFRNTINQAYPFEPLAPEIAAAIVAEDVEQEPWGTREASFSGVGDVRFTALLGEARNAPGLPQLFELWRRDEISDAEFTHGLRKAKLELRWDAPLRALKQRLLSLSDLANARQQGFISTARQQSESELQGLDNGRANILFELSGLPLGVETMQQALNRGLVSRAEFDQAIREGHTKTKYTDLAEALRHPVLSADEYATLHLKGWITSDQMDAGGALHGFTPAQMNLKYLEKGRPAAPGQLWTMAARGIDGPAGRPMDRAQFLKAIQESDIRPEYGPGLWEIRFLFPPLFQTNRLVQSGAITAATGAEWLHKGRYAPEVVAAFEAYWGGGTTAAADPHLGRAETQLWSTLHRSYVAEESAADVAQTTLGVIGVDAAAIPRILALWDAERRLVRKQLSPAQLRKAVKTAVVNPATGAPWTQDEAIERMLELGYDEADARTFLAE